MEIVADMQQIQVLGNFLEFFLSIFLSKVGWILTIGLEDQKADVVTILTLRCLLQIQQVNVYEVLRTVLACKYQWMLSVTIIMMMQFIEISW